MASSFRDPKTLADWIQLDYFRRPGRVWRIRNLLTCSVLIACIALMAATWWPKARFIYQSHPVSSSHAMFNDRCDFCHVQAFQPARRLLRNDPNVRSVPDATCQGCHEVGPHHEGRVTDPKCSTCHQEHRGRPVLAQVADSQCTVCHENLNRHVLQTRFATSISQFSTDHPAFGVWQGGPPVDPGTVRFNHKVHLNLKAEGVRGIDRPLADLKSQQCNYCHRPDAAGRYLMAINYDQHCSQCHPLSVRVAGSRLEEKVSAAADGFAREPAPHKDPQTVQAVLRERYTRFVQDNPGVLGAQQPAEPPRWIPGRPRAQPVTDKEWLWVNEQLQTALGMMFDGANGCRYCHQVDVARGPGNLPRYLPSKITARWFPHSIFSHERHRLLDCAECHAAAPSSDRTRDVLLPQIEDCRKCHNAQVGARTDCAECHRFHDRTREVFKGQKTISECTRKQ